MNSGMNVVLGSWSLVLGHWLSVPAATNPGCFSVWLGIMFFFMRRQFRCQIARIVKPKCSLRRIWLYMDCKGMEVSLESENCLVDKLPMGPTKSVCFWVPGLTLTNEQSVNWCLNENGGKYLCKFFCNTKWGKILV